MDKIPCPHVNVLPPEVGDLHVFTIYMKLLRMPN